MSDGGLLLSWNDSSHTTYMKEEVDRLFYELINISQERSEIIAEWCCSPKNSLTNYMYYVIVLQL